VQNREITDDQNHAQTRDINDKTICQPNKHSRKCLLTYNDKSKCPKPNDSVNEHREGGPTAKASRITMLIFTVLS